MPKLNFKLASQGVNTGGIGGGVRPITVSSGAARGFQAPRLNIRGADVRYTPTPVPQQPVDTTIKSASQFAAVFAKAAFDFQDRQAQVDSTYAVAAFGNEADKLSFGTKDPQGKPVKGYFQTEGKEAVDGFDDYQKALYRKKTEVLANLSPRARQKAMLRIEKAYSNELGRASLHRAKQMKVAEQQAKAVEGQMLLKGFEKDPNTAWGEWVNHANSFQDPVQRAKVLTEGMGFALDKIIDMSRMQGKTPMEAWEAANGYFQERRDSLPETAEVALSSKLQQSHKALAKEQETEQKKALAAYQKRLEFAGSSVILQGLIAGRAGFGDINAYIGQVYQAFPDDPVKARSVVIDNIKDALKGEMYRKGYDSAKAMFDTLQLGVGERKIGVKSFETLTEVRDFVDGELLSLSKNKDTLMNNKWKGDFIAKATQAKSTEELDALVNEAMKSGDADRIKFAYGIGNTVHAKLEGIETKQQKLEQNLRYTQLMSMAETMGNTEQFKNQVYEDLAAGKINIGQWEKIRKNAWGGVTKQDPRKLKELKTMLGKFVTSKDFIYDPSSEEGQVYFKNLAPDDVRERIEKDPRWQQIPDKGKNELLVQSLVEQARTWLALPENKNKTSLDWYKEYFLQRQDVKQGLFGRYVDAVKSYLFSQSPGTAISPLPITQLFRGVQAIKKFTETPEQQSGYQWVPKGAEPVNAPGVSGVMKTTKPGPAQSPIAKGAPKTVEEWALNTVPEGLKTFGSKLNTDQLLAWQALREGNPNIDKMPEADRMRLINRAMKAKGFSEWKTRTVQKISGQ